MSRFLTHKQRGQSAIFVAICLPFLVMLTLTVIEIAERWYEVAMLEDALQQAARSVVQQMDYEAMADGADRLRADRNCHEVNLNSPPKRVEGCRAVIAEANRFLLINLTGVRGLHESPEDVVQQVSWTVLPNGGTCSYTSTAIPAVTEITPLICAQVDPQMQGLLGWGTFSPLITAAETLDPIVR